MYLYGGLKVVRCLYGVVCLSADLIIIAVREFEVINLGQLQKFVDSGKIDPKKQLNRETLINSGIVKGNKDGIKLLNKGELKAKITIEIDAASESSIKAIEKAGGKVSIPAPKERTEKKKSTKK